MQLCISKLNGAVFRKDKVRWFPLNQVSSYSHNSRSKSSIQLPGLVARGCSIPRHGESR